MVFWQEWRRCLAEHYVHVVASGDFITQPSLEDVLREAHYSEADLEALRQRAAELKRGTLPPQTIESDKQTVPAQTLPPPNPPSDEAAPAVDAPAEAPDLEAEAPAPLIEREETPPLPKKEGKKKPDGGGQLSFF